MTLVKCIVRKVYHKVIYLICRPFIYAISNSSSYFYFTIFICTSKYKVFSLFFHYLHFLFTHSTPYKVCTPHRISTNISYYLHYLLLVNNASIRYIKYIFKPWMYIFYLARIVFTGYKRWNLVHRPWSKKGVCSY